MKFSEKLKDKISFRYELDLWRNDRKASKSSKSHKHPKGPALILFGFGAWFSTPSMIPEVNGKKDPDREIRFAFQNISDAMGPRTNNFITDPMDPVEGVGDQAFYFPVSGPYFTGKDKKMRERQKQSGKNVEHYHEWMHKEREQLESSLHFAWSYPRTVENQTGVWDDPLINGWHPTNDVADQQANIALNLRCNAKLDRIKGYPYTRTCCTDYGNKPLVQQGLVIAGIVYLAACIVCDIINLATSGREKPWCAWKWLNIETGAFVMAILLCYYADRTHLFAKGEKHWSYLDFSVFCAPALVLTLISIRRSPAPKAAAPKAGGQLDTPATVPDQPFLNRDQTEEWKGWMQVLILIYHWTAAANSTRIYILMRLLVAAYLFQTGYNHTTFFLKKKDFSFKRVASILLRLNLLPIFLAYFMNTDYMFYYFSPLCSFWFVIIYLTLAIGNKYNDDYQVVVAKICIAMVTTTILLQTPLNRWLFTILRYTCNIHWNISEWEYRLALDQFIVYIGMLTAVAYLQMTESARTVLRWSMALCGIAAIGGYFYNAHSADAYKAWHPYTSFVPILAFVAVRNVSGTARNYYSTAMAWLGKCSLETYTLQFHIFLAADTYGVLLLDAFKGDQTLLNDRWRSLVFIVPVFLWVSSATATATNNLVKCITAAPAPEYQRLPEVEKEGDIELDEEPYSDDPNGGLLNRARSFKYTTYVPTVRSIVYSLPLRIFVMLVGMWCLNVFSPVPDNYVPDGFSEFSAV